MSGSSKDATVTLFTIGWAFTSLVVRGFSLSFSLSFGRRRRSFPFRRSGVAHLRPHTANQVHELLSENRTRSVGEDRRQRTTTETAAGCGSFVIVLEVNDTLSKGARDSRGLPPLNWRAESVCAQARHTWIPQHRSLPCHYGTEPTSIVASPRSVYYDELHRVAWNKVRGRWSVASVKSGDNNVRLTTAINFSCAGKTCHARREFFAPKLQYFRSFKCIQI